jgi:hypothetical protein
MVSVCQRIAKDIRARYTIGYAPASTPAAKEAWRNIRVDVSPVAGRGKLAARTRSVYRYAAAAGGAQ